MNQVLIRFTAFLILCVSIAQTSIGIELYNKLDKDQQAKFQSNKTYLIACLVATLSMFFVLLLSSVMGHKAGKFNSNYNKFRTLVK